MPSAKKKSSSKHESEDWMARMRESSHDVVLAGLASLTRAYGADRTRSQADFRTLVAEGRQLEPDLQDLARKAWSEWLVKPGRMMISQPQGRLQTVFEERVVAVLARLGVPSAADIAELRAKVDGLLEREGLEREPAARGDKKPEARSKTAPRRTTASRRRR